MPKAWQGLVGLGLVSLAGLGGWWAIAEPGLGQADARLAAAASASQPGPSATHAAHAGTAPSAGRSGLAPGTGWASGASPALPTAGPLSDEVRARLQAQWQARLQRAERARDSYRAATRYPHDARPLAEQVDQNHPFEPVVASVPVKLPGRSGRPGWELRLSQDALRIQGSDRVGLRVSAVDADGRALPLQVTRAVAQAVGTGQPTGAGPTLPLLFNDLGQDGDAWPQDGQWSLAFQPGAQGFAGYEGAIRVEVQLRAGDEPAVAWFDLTYTPTAPATWSGPVRSALVDGALLFSLPLVVNQPGRYVASARVDDAEGRPVALLSFNEPLPAGAQTLPLRLFGRLVHDLQPRFPLRLRDVDAFLLHEDRFPDRAPMARLPGVVHQTANHPLASFSTAEWDSAERNRYLQRHEADVQAARAALQRLSPPPGP